jgi:Thrombospondin type 1 domain
MMWKLLKYTSFLQCNKLCGKGKQFRDVTCYKKFDGMIKVIDAGECYADERPESERECSNQPCDGVDWMTSEWTRVSLLIFLAYSIENFVLFTV